MGQRKREMVNTLDDSRKPPPHLEAGRVAGVGIQFAMVIVAFLFAGRWLDGRLGTDPWLLIAGVFIGASAGFYSLYRQLVTMHQTDDADGGGAEP